VKKQLHMMNIWQKKKELQSNIHPLPEPRKPNDGVDQSKWPQIPLKKSDN